MTIRVLFAFIALFCITNSDIIIFSSNIDDNSSEWITSGSIYVNNSECPTNSECFQLSWPNNEIYRYFSIQPYITKGDLEIIVEYNIHLKSFTDIDQYCLVQYTNNINSSWIDLLAYNGANTDIKLINESSFIPQLNGSIIGIKFLLENTASFQSCFINEIRLIATEQIGANIVSTTKPDIIQTFRNDYEYQVSATIDLYYYIPSNIAIQRSYELIKDIAIILLIGFSTSSEDPFDDVIYVDVITNSYDAQNRLNMIASILTYTEHDANMLMEYIDSDFIMDLQNELNLHSITTLNISTDSTLKILRSDNDDDKSEDGFIGMSFELTWIIVLCVGCCILICIAFIFGYYRGTKKLNKNLQKLPSQNPSIVSARSIEDIQRIKELELELKRAKSEQLELKKKAIPLDIEKSKTFSPTLSSGIYHKPSTIFSEGDKTKAIIPNTIDDNMVLGDTNHRISMSHRKKQQLSHIYEAIEQQRIIQHDSDEEDDYVEEDVDSDDFFVEPNTLNQEGVLTKISMTII